MSGIDYQTSLNNYQTNGNSNFFIFNSGGGDKIHTALRRAGFDHSATELAERRDSWSTGKNIGGRK